MRRTKILATLGPASDSPDVLEAMIRAGVDAVRLNFSHGTAAEHTRRVEAVRAAAGKVGKDIGVIADLQGPKIRIERFAKGPVTLKEGAQFTIDAELDPDAGDENRVGIAYKSLPDDVTAGDRLLLNDGQIVMAVERVDGPRIVSRVEVGGELSNNKGVNRAGGGLSAVALTDKDRADIKTAAKLGVDYVAVSFPRDADDIELARKLVREAGGQAGIIAKIERQEAVANIESIIGVSDVVMIARGDLAVEIGDAELPGVQKRIIHMTRDMNRVAITATQMMESMISSPVPTRAEVLDVANAVIDGTDVVMLSAETAAGKYPVKVVEAMARVCVGAEGQRITPLSRRRREARVERVDEAIALAAMYTADHVDAKAIVALTESGSTALWMSRVRSGIPIYAMTRHDTTRRRVTLYRGVYPVPFDVLHSDSDHVLQSAAEELERLGDVKPGDIAIFTKGDMAGVTGGTNSMKIMRVGE
ncbi:MAG TPA: pyruvate kinase [Gammaproteobacteria bacterium]|jgi:pyruvate kinase|nr:pyruvate kinase [Gammaproteobacteria bacterium]